MDERSFERAVERLESVLKERGHPSDIRWVFSDDVCVVGGTVYVKRTLPSENKAAIEQLFNSENAANLGIEFDLVAILGDTAYCSVLVPDDEDTAAELMIRGVKYSIPDRLLECKTVGTLGWMVKQPFRRIDVAPVWGLPNRDV